MNEPIRTPKLEDVARRAGVSPATVSRFFNNPDLLTAKTAEKIREAVADLGYVRNLLAGGLASNRSRLVAVLVPEFAPSLFSETIEAMVNALADEGYMPMLGLTRPDSSRLESLLEAVLARRPDAIILTGEVRDAEMRARLRASNTTVIETWTFPEEPIDVAVGFSHRDVGAQVAAFIAERGYRRPHLIVGDSARAALRRQGFLEHWARTGEAEPTWSDAPIPNRFEHGRLVFRRLLEMPVRPDVVFCGSDLLAQGLLVEAQAAGLKAPDDLAVIGFGNLGLSGAMRPTITTVEIDGGRIGREAVRVLRHRARGEPLEARRFEVGFRIIARESA